VKNKFSENLKKLRESKKLTQKGLAEKLGVTQRKVSYWESGKIEPDLNALMQIAKYFDFPVDYLLT